MRTTPMFDGPVHEMDGRELRGRWRDPPVRGHGRYQQLFHAVRGRYDGCDFWAFTTPEGGGPGPTPHRLVVALDTGHELAMLNVGEPTMPSFLRTALGSRIRERDRESHAVTRVIGIDTGDRTFDRRFLVRTDDPAAARAVLTEPVRQQLLAARRRYLSLQGREVLCWEVASRPGGPLPPEQFEPLLTLAAEVAMNAGT